MLQLFAREPRMKKNMWKLGGRRKHQADRTPLMENNNNKETPDGVDCATKGLDTPLFQNLINMNRERRVRSVDALTVEELAELLHVSGDADQSEDGSCDSQDHTQSVVRIIQRSASQSLPEAPADLDRLLHRHLQAVQEQVHRELVRLEPLLGSVGMTAQLVDCYHRQVVRHLNGLLQEVRSSSSSLVLMDWVLHRYLSEEFFGHPDLTEMDAVEKVDSKPLTEWMEKAEVKLLEQGRREVRGFLEKILLVESEAGVCDSQETYVGFYVDVIQCVENIPRKTQNWNKPELSKHAREVCFEELLTCLKNYSTEQTEMLRNLSKTQKPDTILFLKTLTTCKELKRHVQNNSEGIRISLIQELQATLEKTEDLTLNLLRTIVCEAAGKHLRSYFRSVNNHLTLLIHDLLDMFSSPLWPQDDRKMVLDEVYRLVAHIYVRRLVGRRLNRLRMSWSPNVESAIARDAELLHTTISDLAPGVEDWSEALLRVKDLLESEDMEVMKLTAGFMQTKCLIYREDLRLLQTVLRWKGLSRRRLREVLDAVPLEEPPSGPWYSSCICCLNTRLI